MRHLTWLAVVVLLAGCTSGSGSASRTSESLPASASTSASPQSALPAVSSSAQSSASPKAPSNAGSTSASSSAPAVKNGTPRLEPVGTFDSPLYVTAPRDDKRLYVVERGGLVRIVDGGKTRAEPFLDITSDVRSGGEQGLLSIAFSPSYADDGHVYADYTDTHGDTRVVEFTRGAADRVDPASRRELLKVHQPYPNHNGGLLVFDPTGMLIIGLGDGGSGGDPDDRAQNLADLLGKLLRIDPHPAGGKPYGIPPDNRFAQSAGRRPEIWAYGLRNPWRFSFDAAGTFYLADVGQDAVEEVDVVPAKLANGANYGWSVFEADRRFKQSDPAPNGEALIAPALTYTHENGRCSITGGGVYAGSVAKLRGRYLYGDYCSGEVWAATVDGTSLKDPKKVFYVPAVASFGVDAEGEMYVVSIDGGTVQRITA
jgi:glucose/arabinose dehydrogenase